MPPQPVLAESSTFKNILNDISNNPIPSDELPGNYPGINVPVEAPRFHCAAGYYDEDPLDDLRLTDDSGLSCKVKSYTKGQSISAAGADSRKFTCTQAGVQ